MSSDLAHRIFEGIPWGKKKKRILLPLKENFYNTAPLTALQDSLLLLHILNILADYKLFDSSGTRK